MSRSAPTGWGTFLGSGGCARGSEGLQRPLEYWQHSQITIPPRGTLAGDDVFKRSDKERAAVRGMFDCPRPQPLERPDAVDRRHEICLQPGGIIDHPIEIRDGIVGAEDHRPECRCHGFELAEIRRGGSEHEVEVERRHRCAVDRRGGIADQDRLEPGGIEGFQQADEEGGGIHSPIIPG